MNKVSGKIKADDLCRGEDAKKLREWIARFLEDGIRATEEALKEQGIQYDPNDIPLYQTYRAFLDVTKDVETCRDIIAHYTNLLAVYFADALVSNILSSAIPEHIKPYLLIRIVHVFGINPALLETLKHSIANLLFNRF